MTFIPRATQVPIRFPTSISSTVPVPPSRRAQPLINRRPPSHHANSAGNLHLVERGGKLWRRRPPVQEVHMEQALLAFDQAVRAFESFSGEIAEGCNLRSASKILDSLPE